MASLGETEVPPLLAPTQDLFDAVYSLSKKYSTHEWTGFDTLSVWCPPPEIARRLISFVLETWVEKPLTTYVGSLFCPAHRTGLLAGLVPAPP
jgi:hypothetical protein